jgi:hypothetical protein
VAINAPFLPVDVSEEEIAAGQGAALIIFKIQNSKFKIGAASNRKS